MKDKRSVERRKRAHAMGDHHNDGLPRSQYRNCARQRRLALRVEICVRFIENGQKRRAVDCARKTQALPLASG